MGDTDPPESTLDRADARQRDERDPLARFRTRFDIPDAQYMDGNSLGPISDAAAASLTRVIEEWRELGIRGWTDAEPDWFHTGERLGDGLAPLLGAQPEEVVIANSTTTNIHTLIGTFLDRLPGTPAGPDPSEDAPAVLVNELDFPTDHYAIRAQFRSRGIDPDEKLVAVESRDGRTIQEADIEAELARRDDIGIVFFPAVLYRSGQLFDLERITTAAHAHGAVAGFDLAHSVGVIPHDLSTAGVDFAVWCSYKYLNAGPGAIAGLYVASRHFGTTPALPGWWGHDKETQFDMRSTFTPADSAGAWQIGTIPLLSAAPLEGALEIHHDAGIQAIREKSTGLTEYLIDLVDARLPGTFTVGSPRESDRRGGHVAVEHPEAYRVAEALKDRGIVVDCRPPDVIRICPAPLYVSYEDVWLVIDELREIAQTRAYETYDPPSGGVT